MSMSTKSEDVQKLRSIANRVESFNYSKGEFIKMLEGFIIELKEEVK